MSQEFRGATYVVRYDPATCTHSANCVRGLPAVFDAGRTPWIAIDGAPEEAVRRQVAACPSGALTITPLVTGG
jgi:uncharacterized Fe-S cluster protein YjdI